MRVTPSISSALALTVWRDAKRLSSKLSRKKNVPSLTVSVANTI